MKLISRDEKYFNFIKDKEIDGDIKTIISEKNESIKNFNTNKKPEEYFLMIESDIPFLNEGEDDFGDLFEFLDFPGVNESNIKEGEFGWSKTHPATSARKKNLTQTLKQYSNKKYKEKARVKRFNEYKLYF